MNEHRPLAWTRAWKWRTAGALLVGIGATICHLRWRSSEEWGLHVVPATTLGLVLLWLLDGLVAMARSLHRPTRDALRWLGSSEPWKALAWRVAALATIVGLFYNLEFWRGRRAWAAVEREAERRGDDLNRRGAAVELVPDEQNLAMAPVFEPLRRVLAARVQTVDDILQEDLGPLSRVKEWYGAAHGQGRPGQRPMLAPWTLGLESELDRWLKYWPGEKASRTKERPAEPKNTMSRSEAATEVLRRLGEWESDIEQLRNFAARPYCRFHQDYARQMWREDQVSPVLCGYLRLVGLRSTALLAVGRKDEAFADALLVLRLVDHSRQQPRAIGGLMRLYRQTEGLQPVWEGLRCRRWSAAQVKELQARLRALDILPDYPVHVRNDAAASADLIEAFLPARRNSGVVPMAERRDPSLQGLYAAFRLLYPSGWSLMDQSAGWAFLHRVTADAVDPVKRRVYSLSPEWTVPSWGTSDPLFPVFVAPKLQAMGHDAVAVYPMLQTALDEAEVACALERCRLARGRFPARLDDLVPDFMDRLPHDLHTGEALHYLPSGDGFRLYAVGGRQVDDGGRPSERQSGGYPDPLSGDWVWDGGGAATSGGAVK